MTINEFLDEFKNMIQRDEDVTLDMELQDLIEWDSMSVMACMAWFNIKLGIKLTYKMVSEQKTVKDIVALAEGKIA